MEITILKPIGYCYGVKEAIKIAHQARLDNPLLNVYVLGMLVHNEQVIKELDKDNIKTLDIRNKKAEELLESVENGSVIVFSAHGHDQKLDKIAKEKNLIIYDAICPRVQMNIDAIKKALKEGKKVLYIGQDKHPETIAALSISKDVILYDDKILINNQISTNNSIFIINQTTLNYLALADIYHKILNIFPHAEATKEVCSTARLRQQAIEKLGPDIDALIVIGSSYSSNTKKLVEIAESSHPNMLTIMVLDEKELSNYDLENKNHIALISGASTPPHTIDVIYDYLNKRYN
jgi:4-hydroxy-3-methylbut-2-enyl diphosphate reductase